MSPLLTLLPAWQAAGMATFWVAFFALCIGHALADFSLQGDFLSQTKNRHGDAGRFFPDHTPPPRGLWVHALTAHALIHAGAVWLVSASATLAAAELVLHWLIDYAKCEGWTSFTADQLLHLACKAAYAALLATGALSQWAAWPP